MSSLILSDIDEKEMAHELTMSGLEVEAIEHIRPQFKKYNHCQNTEN